MGQCGAGRRGFAGHSRPACLLHQRHLRSVHRPKKMRNGDCEGNFGPSLPLVDKGHHRALSSSSVPFLHLWSTTVLLFVESTTGASLLPRSTTIASLLPRSSSSIYHCSFTSSSIYHHLPSTQVYDFFISVDTIDLKHDGCRL
ncbi:hypothetical protein YC2023_019457 [Brassica napus]